MMMRTKLCFLGFYCNDEGSKVGEPVCFCSLIYRRLISDSQDGRDTLIGKSNEFGFKN